MRLNLTPFGPEEYSQRVGGIPKISFGKKGRNGISVEAARLIGLKSGDHIMIFQNDDFPEMWHVSKRSKGYEVHGDTPKCKNQFWFFSRGLADTIIECFNDEKVNLIVVDNAVEQDGCVFWPLTTTGELPKGLLSMETNLTHQRGGEEKRRSTCSSMKLISETNVQEKKL